MTDNGKFSEDDLYPDPDEALMQVHSNNVPEEAFEEVKDFVQEEFPGAKSGKDFIGRMAFVISASTIHRQKQKAVAVRQKWSEIKRENKKLLTGDYLDDS